MRAGKKKIYWDTSIFLAWLKDEPQEPHIIDGIEEVVRRVRSNEVILLTSIMARIEILEASLTEEAIKKFNDFFKRRNVSMISLDPRVGDKAHYIRNFYSQNNVKLSSPDCTHLATAIIYGADEFQTLDGAGKRKRPNDLIPLSGNVAGHNLVIRVPHAEQTTMFSDFRALPRPGRRKITLED